VSVRAHRILSVEYAPETSFNLYHDEKLIDFLQHENDLGFYDQMNGDGGGKITVNIEALQKAIDQAKELELDEVTVRVLGEDIAAAKVHNEDYVDYDCF